MRVFRCVILSAILLTSFVSQIPAAVAAPIPIFAISGGPTMPHVNNGLIQKASGCHRYRQYHQVFLWRYPVWHRHLPDCSPIPARPPIDRSIIYRDSLGYYCHPQWRMHRHPRWGKNWHRHAGRNCVVSRGWVWRGGPRAGCHKVGHNWICG